MPKEKSVLKFDNYYKQLNVPFVIYADFEAITEKIDSCQPNNKKSYTNKYQQHTDCGFAYKVVCCYDDELSKDIVVFRGENAVHKFLESMLKEKEYCEEMKKKHFNKDMIMTKDDIINFKNATCCHICGIKYNPEDDQKLYGPVRDHCHVTGKYRGSAHNNCNLRYKLTDKIPVVFHNLKGYDSHFIMQEIGKFDLDVGVIPNNMEKYMSFMFGPKLVFIDSFQFMSCGLDVLVKNLPKDKFKYTGQKYKGNKLELMQKKGVYPYDYMDSFDKFDVEKLPLKDEFYSILNDTHIADTDYEHAKKEWSVFGLKNMGEYHDLYLESDVLLLCDVFENFRSTCQEYYGLDPCHYFTSPGLSWDALLKMTKVRLEL